MPQRADDPLRRVTLNLYEADITEMERIYGHGWSTVVRDLLHSHIMDFNTPPTPRTLGDLADD